MTTCKRLHRIDWHDGKPLIASCKVVRGPNAGGWWRVIGLSGEELNIHLSAEGLYEDLRDAYASAIHSVSSRYYRHHESGKKDYENFMDQLDELILLIFERGKEVGRVIESLKEVWQPKESEVAPVGT